VSSKLPQEASRSAANFFRENEEKCLKFGSISKKRKEKIE